MGAADGALAGAAVGTEVESLVCVGVGGRDVAGGAGTPAKSVVSTATDLSNVDDDMAGGVAMQLCSAMGTRSRVRGCNRNDYVRV